MSDDTAFLRRCEDEIAAMVVEAGRRYRAAVKASYRAWDAGEDGFGEAMAEKREAGRALDEALAAYDAARAPAKGR